MAKGERDLKAAKRLFERYGNLLLSDLIEHLERPSTKKDAGAPVQWTGNFEKLIYLLIEAIKKTEGGTTRQAFKRAALCGGFTPHQVERRYYKGRNLPNPSERDSALLNAIVNCYLINLKRLRPKKTGSN